jgi:hypothetical protein
VASWLEEEGGRDGGFARDAAQRNDLGVAPLEVLIEGVDRAAAAHARVAGRGGVGTPLLGPRSTREPFLGGALPGSAFGGDARARELPGCKEAARKGEGERRARRREASTLSVESGHVPRFVHLGGGSGGSTAAWQPPDLGGGMAPSFAQRASQRPKSASRARPSTSSGDDPFRDNLSGASSNQQQQWQRPSSASRSRWAGQPGSQASTANSTPREPWQVSRLPKNLVGAKTFGREGDLCGRPRGLLEAADASIKAEGGHSRHEGGLVGLDRHFVGLMLGPRGAHRAELFTESLRSPGW